MIAKDGSAINPIRRRQPCTIHLNPDGYPCFGGGVPVHMYVATAWVDGCFEGADINHKDFDRMNYHADHLEWVSHSDNVRDTLKYNYENVCRSKQGKMNGRARFTEAQVLKIRELYDSGMSVADICKYFHPEYKTVKDYRNIHSTISAIAKRTAWKNI